jgi:glycosyltransferase involved in cell wall biosynthesis
MICPRVIYWNSQPSPYVVERFNAVVANGNVQLEAWFDKERDADRSWEVDPSQWRFPAVYLPKARIGPMLLPFPDKQLQNRRPDVLITPMDRRAGMVAALVGRVISERVASRTLPVFETWVKKTVWSESVNHFLYRSIDGAKVSGTDAAAMARHYGLPPDRAWTVTQSIDLALYKQAHEVTESERTARRRSLGLQRCAFIYVGRLDHSKGLEYLIRAFRILEEQGCDASLLILGDGPHEREFKELAAGLEHVHFIGFVQPRMLPSWYAIADAFVFPTLGDPNGLVVEESMAAGLPVISTTNAGDISTRVRDGETGFLVPPFDEVSLANRMRDLAGDSALRDSMGRSALAVADGYAMNRYADDFDRFISGILSMPERRGPCVLAARALGTALVRAAKPVANPR